METLPASARDEFRTDLRAAQAEVLAGVVAQRSDTDRRIWREKWVPFCQSLGYDPYLTGVADPVPIVQVFFRRVRDGRLALEKHAIRARSAEAYLRAVGQTCARLGKKDVRLDSTGNIDFRLQRQLKYYKNQDPESSRRQPFPVELLHTATARLTALGTPKALAIVNMMWIAFYFLMRPGEFCDSGTSSHPFLFRDVTLKAGNLKLDLRRSTEAQLRSATFVTLTFSDQKSAVRGERVGHGRSGTTKACPVESVVDRVIYLRRIGAPDTAPLCSFSFAPGGPLLQLKSKDFTDTLRVEAAFCSEQYGINPKDVSVGCFRTTGAMALFCANVDSSRIRLLGRWNSWTMLRYLHLQSDTAMNSLARRMMNGGSFLSIQANPPPPRNPEAPDAPPCIVPNPDPST